MKNYARQHYVDQNPEKHFKTLESYYGDIKSKIFLHASCKKYIDDNELLKKQEVFYVKPSHASSSSSVLLHDLTKRNAFMDGSVFFMIASSIFMGFKELYLCGCGYTYQPLQSGHYYEDWTQLDHEPVDNKHHIMKKFADEYGVKIYNVVPDGFESPVYEKVSWENVVNNVLDKRR